MKKLNEFSTFELQLYVDWLFDNYTLTEIIEFPDDNTTITIAFYQYLDDILPF